MRRLIANSILSLISPLLLFTLQIHSLNAREVTVINNCTFTVWPVISSSSSSVANLSLKNQDSFTVDLQPSGSAFLWGRTLCGNSTGKLYCRTGDCGDNNCASIPLSWLFGVTFLEFHLDDVEGDTYDVRVERGYNVAVSVAPRGGNGSMCGVAGCVFNGTAGGQDSHLMTISRACPRAQANNSANELSCRGAHSYTVTFCPTSTSIIRYLIRSAIIRSFNRIAVREREGETENVFHRRMNGQLRG
uniref:Receptor protein serine/threonine kinase n=1 Tax=Opuntia streptacantha TaxID=393608 RepID=A0A7C9AEW4_OPUST